MDEKQKIRIKRILLITIPTLLVLIAAIYVYSKQPFPTGSSARTSAASPLKSASMFSKDKVQADAMQLVSIIESTHPAFSLHDVPKGYAEAKKTFLSASSRNMTAEDFFWCASAYLTSLEDGHTTIYLNSSSPCLNVSWQAKDNGLYLIDGNGKLSNRQVTEIGGVPVQQVFQTIDRFFPVENEAGRERNYILWSLYKAVLIRAGVRCDTDHIAITVKDGNKTTEKDIAFTSKNPLAYYQPDITASSQTIGDVFYIDLNVCKVDGSLSDTVTKLKQAVDTGVTKVIIDVRDNPGGNSSACQKLLEAMDMTIPQYGVYIRYSPLAKEQHGYPDQSDSYEISPDVGTAKPNPKISLAILTNENTFSSATMLGVWVQDGKLGTVIGRPSANNPNCYGDVLKFQLNNSRLQGQISFKRWIRPNTKADPKTLQPDVAVPFGEDILQNALNFLDKN